MYLVQKQTVAQRPSGDRKGNVDVCRDEQSGEVRGLEAARQFAAAYREAFPDLQTAIEDQVAEGDEVVSRFSGRGTHLGETEDFGQATGNRIEITGVTIDRFADGRIVEEWTNPMPRVRMDQEPDIASGVGQPRAEGGRPVSEDVLGSTQDIDEAKVEAFAEQMLGVLNDAMLAEAGFSEVEVEDVEGDIFNNYFIARKG